LIDGDYDGLAPTTTTFGEKMAYGELVLGFVEFRKLYSTLNVAEVDGALRISEKVLGGVGYEGNGCDLLIGLALQDIIELSCEKIPDKDIIFDNNI
jgi:hypothetical protein